MIISFNHVGGIMLVDLFLLSSVFKSLLWMFVTVQACATELARAICPSEEPHSYGLHLFWGLIPFFKSNLLVW